MTCKECGAEMYERKSKKSADATVVYVCKKCGAYCYVWNNSDDEWEINRGK